MLYVPPMSADEEGMSPVLQSDSNANCSQSAIQRWPCLPQIPKSTLVRPLCLDALIHTRITNDERPLRRATRKFHTYFNTAYSPIVSPVPDAAAVTGSVEEAREAFLVELASFELLLKKSKLVCQAEDRQVEEYRKESTRIGMSNDDRV